MANDTHTKSPLRFQAQEQRGLHWLQQRSACWLHNYKLYRKYHAPRGANLTKEEMYVLTALFNLNKSLKILLDDSKKNPKTSA